MARVVSCSRVDIGFDDCYFMFRFVTKLKHIYRQQTNTDKDMDIKVEDDDDGSWIPQLINHMTKQDCYQPQVRMFNRLNKVSNGVKGYTERVLQQLEIILMKEIVRWPKSDKLALIQKCGVYYFGMRDDTDRIFIRWIGFNTWGILRNEPSRTIGGRNHWSVMIGKPPFTLDEWKHDVGKYDDFLLDSDLSLRSNDVINFEATTIIAYHLKEKHNDGSEKLQDYSAELQVVDDEVLNHRWATK